MRSWSLLQPRETCKWDVTIQQYSCHTSVPLMPACWRLGSGSLACGVSRWTFMLRFCLSCSQVKNDSVCSSPPSQITSGQTESAEENTERATTNKQLRLFQTTDKRGASWSRWTQANWQQPLCCDDTSRWHRLKAIVGLCRPWRRRWWWRRLTMMAEGESRCQPPPTGNH